MQVEANSLGLIKFASLDKKLLVSKQKIWSSKPWSLFLNVRFATPPTKSIDLENILEISNNKISKEQFLQTLSKVTF